MAKANSEVDSPFPKLLALVNRRHRRFDKGFPTYVFPPLMQRSDGYGVFEEGEIFSGMKQCGIAEACLTVVPSPHIAATISRESFMGSAEKILQRSVKLPPAMREVPYLSPQLIAWWRRNDSPSEPFDFGSISDLDVGDRIDFLEVISDQVGKGARIIDDLGGEVIVWGTWGNGTPEELSRFGFTRGGPTNKLGHCHISSFKCNDVKPIMNKQYDYRDLLIHYSPWVVDFQEQFGDETSTLLEQKATYFLDDGTKLRSEIKKERIQKSDGGLSLLDGYNLMFEPNLDLCQAMGLLIDLSDQFERYYQKMVKLHEGHYLGRPESWEEMINTSHAFGYPEEAAIRIASYSTQIRPTYGQLIYWKDQLELTRENNGVLDKIKTQITKYERFNKKIKEKGIRNARTALIFDTTRSPEEYGDIRTTWSAHSSFCYLIPNPYIDRDRLSVHSLQLFPLLVTTEAVPERIHGGVLKRALPKV